MNVKTKGLYWLFFGTKINFTLESPSAFALADYTGLLEGKKAENTPKKEYNVTVSDPEGNSKNYRVTIDPDMTVKNTFTVIASSRPKKTEIILKLPEGKQFELDEVKLTLQFKKPIAEAHNRTIVFTIPPTRLKCNCPVRGAGEPRTENRG